MGPADRRGASRRGRGSRADRDRPEHAHRELPGGAGRELTGRADRELLRRTLSQNFLRAGRAVDQFIAAADLDPDGLVVEVGAGEGALTVELARRSRAVIAFEVDHRLAARLEADLREHTNLRVVAGDFLDARPPAEPFQLAGNIPFALTSEIVNWCLDARALTAATLITQLEYARKRTGWYGRWSLRTIQSWPLCSWDLRARIARTQFRPVPRVDAGVLRITRRERPLIARSAMPAYRRMVELGFTGLGGTLHASLARRYPADRLGAAFRAAALDRGTVVAFAGPDAWLRLFDALEGH